MLRGVPLMVRAALGDGLAFDPFSLQRDGLAAPEVDVGRGWISDALMVAAIVVGLFLRYVLKIDAGRIATPSNPI